MYKRQVLQRGKGYSSVDLVVSVSYTHITLPTKLYVDCSVVCVALMCLCVGGGGVGGVS